MFPRVLEVSPNADYTLTIKFSNGETRLFDVSEYLEKGAFKELKDKKIFYSVRPFLGSIQWNNELDLCPDTLYIDSKPLN